MQTFKVFNDDKPFTLSHCWLKLKDEKKWQDYLQSQKKQGTKEEVDTSERPRGHKNSKKESRIDASSLAIQEALKGLITQKEVISSKREEREEMKRQKKEEAKEAFFELTKKRLDIEELNA